MKLLSIKPNVLQTQKKVNSIDLHRDIAQHTVIGKRKSIIKVSLKGNHFSCNYDGYKLRIIIKTLIIKVRYRKLYKRTLAKITCAIHLFNESHCLNMTVGTITFMVHYLQS